MLCTSQQSSVCWGTIGRIEMENVGINGAHAQHKCHWGSEQQEAIPIRLCTDKCFWTKKEGYVHDYHVTKRAHDDKEFAPRLQLFSKKAKTHVAVSCIGNVIKLHNGIPLHQERLNLNN